MAINIVDVEEVLRQRPQPLTLVSLEALNPARQPYRAILLQPTGLVEANDVRVGHADPAMGYALCSGFLSSAVKGLSDLAVAPEYCIPWSVVQNVVAGKYRPPQGAIWVLGCESISPAAFQALAEQYNAAGDCVFHYEPIDARQAAQRRYVDPLLYVFWAQNQEGQSVLFLLAQLKTVACRDYRDVEQTSLCLGKTVYAFNRGINSMSLVSIICSDANDGFADALTGYQAIAEHLQLTSQASPLAVERAIEILMGPRGNPSSWYTVKELDAVHLDKDEESIRRVTVHQDPDLTRPGSAYRLQRLQRAHDAIGLAQSDVPWPPPVQDLANGFKLSWKPSSPHHNVEPKAGGRGPASLVYLSDQANNSAVESTHQKLRQALTTHAANEACATRLRARHSKWYAKTELKTVTIQDSFGKFNFLDTDAAVELSVSAGSAQIGSDVTRLVLGATAESLADRLRRVLKQLQDELKTLKSDKSSNKQLKLAGQTRLDAIKAAPKLSDSLFLELLAALKGQGWSQPPDEKGQLETLREHLQEATSANALVRHSSIKMLHADPDSALRLLTNLNDEASKADALDQRAKAARLAQTNAGREAQAVAELSAAMEPLLPYARTDFPQLVKQASECRDRVRTRNTRLSPVANLGDTSVIQQFLEKPVTDAIDSVDTEIGVHQRRLDAAQTSLQALEKTQSTMTVLRQRLLGTAKDVLQRSANPDHCPLCKTEFEEGQLLARMMADVEVGTSEQASLLQTDISSASESMTDARAMLALLYPLLAFAGDGAQTLMVAQALEQIVQERAAFERDQQELETIQAQAQQLQSDGLSSKDLSTKLLTAGMAELPSLKELQRIQSNHKVTLETLQSAEKTALHESNLVRQECDAMAECLSIEALGDTDNLARSVKKLISDADAALGARQTLTSIMTISTETTAEEIALNLAAIQRLLAHVATAVAQECANNKALNDETKNVEGLVKKIKCSDTKITCASEAERVLDTLAEQSLGRALENQILTENAAEIARTFASIHMPNEFEIQIAHGKLAVIRRSTGAEVQLEHMSTGQRAAFALSLFLAMNGRLRSGPPVLLFDDPVAHIDDINMLSFLDHLRHLAISGKRQIFFATANTKLAGLFRHKFRFLGDEFKELRLSRTS